MLSIVKLGNYLSQGVYAPFQGAVDIIVVQQDDGSFRSSPWYVRRFDPQGADGSGRRVEIWVNDVKASFSMALNSKGEAFFEKQVDASPQLYSSYASPPKDAERLQASLEILAQDNEETLTFGRGFLLTDTQRRPVLQGELTMLPNVHPREEAVEIVDESLTIAVSKKVRVEVGEEAQFGLTSRSSDAVQCDTMLHTVIAEDWFALQKIQTAGLEGDTDTTTADEIFWDDHNIVITAAGENNRSMSDGQYVVPLGSVSDGLVDGNNGAKSDDCALEPVKNSCMSEKNAILKVEEEIATKGSRDIEIPKTASISRSKWWSLSLRKSSPGMVADVTSAISRDGATQVTVGNPSINKPLKHNVRRQLSQKRIVQSYLPTSDHISSLRLKEGRNKIAFTFPGDPRKSQVDANVYLWKWNTRIVISDVDGTITKSDVLGQFMPLVGKDWSQSGVARLFSAIKENGYELLFLSARSISQSHLTRQFLGNLSQDGVTLPDGPVFISPDGLLPSLYREVIKRTPHEFKISCLEEVRKLFPRDVNPFYAGFGNRITDEISYRRVGIPRGKIFMINPKGEVMVNNHVHVKTYTSIHELVDGMFPAVFSSEQEDFNSWNFWKLPIPNLADEISEKSSRTRRCRSARK